MIKCWTCRHFESQSFLILGVDAPCIIASVMNFGLHRARLVFLVWQLIKNIFFILLVDRPAAQKHLHIYQFLPADRIDEEAPSRKTNLREPLDVFPPQAWDLTMLHRYVQAVMRRDDVRRRANFSTDLSKKRELGLGCCVSMSLFVLHCHRSHLFVSSVLTYSVL